MKAATVKGRVKAVNRMTRSTKRDSGKEYTKRRGNRKRAVGGG